MPSNKNTPAEKSPTPSTKEQKTTPLEHKAKRNQQKEADNIMNELIGALNTGAKTK